MAEWFNAHAWKKNAAWTPLESFLSQPLGLRSRFLVRRELIPRDAQKLDRSDNSDAEGTAQIKEIAIIRHQIRGARSQGACQKGIVSRIPAAPLAKRSRSGARRAA